MSVSISLCAAIISILPLNNYQEKKACEYAPIIEKYSKLNNLEPELVAAVMYTESGFYKTVVSKAGACGLMQIIPKWTGYAATNKIKYTCAQLKNPKTAIMAGARILSYVTKVYAKGNIDKGICYYNAGNRCIDKKRKNLHKKLGYVKKVKKIRDLIKSARLVILEKGIP